MPKSKAASDGASPKRLIFTLPPGVKRTKPDWKKIDAYENTAADYEEIPEITDADMARAQFHIGGVPHPAPKRGRPPKENAKEAIKLRIDSDIVARYRASGAGWQTRMNDALRKAAPAARKAAKRKA